MAKEIIEYVLVSWFSFFFCLVILEFAKNLSEQTGVFKTVQASRSTNELLRKVKYYVLHLVLYKYEIEKITTIDFRLPITQRISVLCLG